MKLTKQQIHRLQAALKRAEKAEGVLHTAISNLVLAISETTGVDGNVDFLPGDGFGFAPVSSNNDHMKIELLIQMAKNGDDITEELILKNLTL